MNLYAAACQNKNKTIISVFRQVIFAVSEEGNLLNEDLTPAIINVEDLNDFSWQENIQCLKVLTIDAIKEYRKGSFIRKFKEEFFFSKDCAPGTQQFYAAKLMSASDDQLWEIKPD